MSTTRKPLLVQKFGGTSLADLKGFDASAKVIAEYVGEYRVIVVLSAVKGVTDLLLAAIDTSVAGDDGAGHLEEAIRRERAIVSDLAAEGFETPQATSYLDEQEAVLTRMVEGIRLLGQCPDETRARILATGEGFASHLMVDVLQARGYHALWSDTDVLPPANDDWLDSLVDIDADTLLRTHGISAPRFSFQFTQVPFGNGTVGRQTVDARLAGLVLRFLRDVIPARIRIFLGNSTLGHLP